MQQIPPDLPALRRRGRRGGLGGRLRPGLGVQVADVWSGSLPSPPLLRSGAFWTLPMIGEACGAFGWRPVGEGRAALRPPGTPLVAAVTG